MAFGLVLDLTTAGVLLVFLGFGIIAIATIFSTRSERGEVKGGGVVMIGPIPIIFGSDAKWTGIAIAFALVLVLLSLWLTFRL